ncbi:MAG: acetyl-CoA synthase subunit gamma [Candidatus Aminicenantes bacterium]|nr:MAG: acetyl-CoA synthase subunit gamma [Candidatus Aminicenantes bacterium]
MKSEKKETSCCASTSCCLPGQEVHSWPEIKGEFITGWIDTNTEVGKIPKVSTRLNKSDKWGGIKVRLKINRMSYKVDPGLYAVGNPAADSPVLVSANYKLSFDTLRKELKGIDAWILVLDTKGINVWCAAGKGTFGTDELVNRIEVSGLKHIVKHRKLIVPQLGAVGVSAHKVRKRSGLSVIYGPVRASDIPVFLESGMKTTPGMRQVSFSFYDRLKVTPVEIVQSAHYLFFISAAFFLFSGLSGSGYSLNWRVGIISVLNLVMAYVAGTLIGPLLLPWLPGRSFSFKGAFAGIIVFMALFSAKLTGGHIIRVIAWLLLIPALSSFLTMNFTGSSTYTSLSGVKKEIRAAVPMQITGAVIGLALWISGQFI